MIAQIPQATLNWLHNVLSTVGFPRAFSSTVAHFNRTTFTTRRPTLMLHKHFPTTPVFPLKPMSTVRMLKLFSTSNPRLTTSSIREWPIVPLTQHLRYHTGLLPRSHIHVPCFVMDSPGVSSRCTIHFRDAYQEHGCKSWSIC